MPWDKSPPELVERFMEVVPDAPDVVQRSMFGYPSATVNGHMFMGLHREDMVIRLGDDDLAAFRERGAADFEPMAGRPMTGFGVVPRDILADRGELARWVGRALEHARSRPPKAAKPAKPSTARAPGRAATGGDRRPS